MRSPFWRGRAPIAETEKPLQKNLARPSAEDIYRQVASNARQELARTNTALAISGFGGGAFMGLSALGTAIAAALLGEGSSVYMLTRIFYPLGFIVVIIGRSQLFTENTLYPVALVLAEKRRVSGTPCDYGRLCCRQTLRERSHLQRWRRGLQR